MNNSKMITVVVKSASVPVRVVVVVSQPQGDVRVVHLYHRSLGLSTSTHKVTCEPTKILKTFGKG